MFFYSGEVAAAPLGGWETRTWLADKLPKAKEYWAVVRFERQGIPKPAAISTLLGHIAEVQAQADHRHIPLTGIQLDIDAPTRALPEYAAFLRQFRRGLSPSLPLSITALLDWFRDGTSVADVIAEVDEFVPQFYDVAQAADPVPMFSRFHCRTRARPALSL